jgi:hypothetical protein
MYYLEQPSIDSTKKKWLLDTETGSKLSHLSSDDINLQLLTLENKLYKIDKNKHYQYFPQDNIEVKGKLLSNPKVNPKKLSVTMLLKVMTYLRPLLQGFILQKWKKAVYLRFTI